MDAFLFAATEADLKALAALEGEWSSEPWSEQAFCDFLKSGHAHIFLKKEKEEIVAYAAFTALAGYGELLTFGVASAHRRRGYGKKLLSAVLDYVTEQKLTDFTLEVRRSNLAARALYESLGAKEVGTRKDFYTAPKEDALLYTFSRKDTDR